MSRIKKITRLTSKLVPDDVLRTSAMLKNAVKTGWQKGREQVAVDNKGLVRDAYEGSKGVAREIKNLKFSYEDIPAIVGAICTVAPIPVPGLGFGVYMVGIGIRKIIKSAHK